MAMFGDNPDLVDVTTPDGRVVKVPRALASMNGFAPPAARIDTTEYGSTPGITTPPPPPPPPPPVKRFGGGVIDDMEVGRAAPNVLPSAVGMSGAEPVVEPNTAQGRAPVLPQGDQLVKDMKGRAAQRAKDDAAAASAPPTPAPGGPMSEDQLRKIGAAGIYNESTKAIDNEEAAGKNLADLQAGQQIKMADAYAKRNAELDQMFAKRKADAEAAQQEIEAKHIDYTNAVDKYASTKIDRGADHPIMAAIFVALGAAGAVMNKDNRVAALDALQAGIDRKVAGQMADLDRQKGVLGMKREGINMLREKASDRLAMTNLTIAGETEKAARQIEEITARSNSDIVKANGAQLAAQLRGRKVEALGKAVEFQTAKDERDRTFKEQVRQANQSAGIAAGHLSLARDQFAYMKSKDAADRKLEYDKLELASLKALKGAQQGGIGGNVTTKLDDKGKPVLDKDGKPIVTVDILKNADGSVFVPEKEEKTKLVSERSGVQAMYDTGRQIAAWREKYGGTNTKTSPAAQAEYDRLKNNMAQAYADVHHVSLADEQSQNFAANAMLGADPSQYNISGVRERIDRALQDQTNIYHSHLQGAGYTGTLPSFVDRGDWQDAAPTVQDEQVKAVISGKANSQRVIETMNAVYGQAITNPDPKIRANGRAFLQSIAGSATDSDLRDQAKAWAAAAERYKDKPAAPGDSEPTPPGVPSQANPVAKKGQLPPVAGFKIVPGASPNDFGPTASQFEHYEPIAPGGK